MYRRIDEAYRTGHESGYRDGYITGRQEILDMLYKDGLAINNSLYNPEAPVIKIEITKEVIMSMKHDKELMKIIFNAIKE